MSVSRREFTAVLGAATLTMLMPERAHGYPLGLQPGLQLWSVKDALQADMRGTLQKLARLGFRELELYELPAAAHPMRQLCDDLGLSLVGAHLYLQSLASARTIETAHALGLRYLIVVFPTLRSLEHADVSRMSWRELIPLYERVSLDDYRWNAEQLDRYGEQLKRQGLQLGYHNHAVDFKRLGEQRALDELIDRTQPELVVFELDCGHAVHAGADPIHYLERYPTRIQLLHLKDLKPGFGISTTIDTEDKDTNAELGAGVIDWRRLFAVAARGRVQHAFIELEGRMADPPMVAVANSLRFLQQLPAQRPSPP